MINVSAYRHQYGVGQGCFHLQTLEFSDGAGFSTSYRFAYDCGASMYQKTKTLNWCIKHATAGAQQLEIDAVYLSHFEDDHVNGLEELCKHTAVNRIYAPHIDVQSAVHIIAQQMAAGTTWSASNEQFASTLMSVARGDGIFGVPVTLVGRGEPPPEGAELPNDLGPNTGGDNQTIRIIAPTAHSISHGVRVPVVVSRHVAQGPGIPHKVVWEMVHWYYGADDGLTAQILAQIETISGYGADCQPGLEATATSAQVKLALLWMKNHRAQIAAAYVNAMDVYNAGRSNLVPPQPPFPYNHNVASLCLYSGPVNAVTRSHNTNAKAVYCMRRWCCIFGADENRGSWIATGDAMLGITDVWNQFAGHFGMNRLDACSTVLVPHHGADAKSSQNFTDELIRADQYCVISAGAKNVYQHPHKNVVNAILRKPASLQLVRETDPLGFAEYLAFELVP